MKKLRDFFTEKRMIWIIVVISILARLFYLKIPFIINVADGAGYVAMATEALKGHWASFFDNYIYRTPTYPLFIALNKIFFGNNFVYSVPLLQHFFGVIMAILIFFIGKKVFDKRVGFLAALLTGISAYSIYWEHNSMSDFFFAFITVFSFYFFFRALLYDKKKDYILFGILFGLNLLTRPLFQFFIVTFPVIIYFFNNKPKEIFKRVLYILVPTIIIIAPWFYQNWVRHHYFGFTPFLGVQLMVRAQNYMNFDSPLRAKEKQVYLQAMFEIGKCTQMTIKDGTCSQVAVAGWTYLQRILKYSPTESDRALVEIAKEAIMGNFPRYLRETVFQMNNYLKVYRTENFYGDLDLDAGFREQYALKLYQGDFWTIWHQKMTWKMSIKIWNYVILAVIGMLLAILKKNKKSFLFILVAIYIFSVTCAIEEGVVSRYRIPLDPYIFLFASYTVFSIIDLVKSINKRIEEGIVIEKHPGKDKD